MQLRPARLAMTCSLMFAVGGCQQVGTVPQAGPAAAAAPGPRVGDVVFQTDFEAAEALTGWSSPSQFGPGYQSARSLFVERPAGSSVGSTMVQMPLPVEKVRGCLLHFSGMVKAENVSERPASWNGVKFMAPIVAPSGNAWPQGGIGVGTFDWQHVIFAVRVPDDVTSLSLYLGLESVTGKVWFDDIKITVRKLPLVAELPKKHEGPLYKGHDLPRLRGAMVSPNIDEESLRLFGKDWNANVIRWQLVGWKPTGPTLDLAAYDAWLEGQLQKLDAALPLCRKYGLLVVVDLHCAPGGSSESGKGLFSDAACQKKFIEVWQMMARKYNDTPGIWGYDLLNEPNESVVAEDLDDWQDLVERTARAVRAIEPDRAIIVEPAVGANPGGLNGFHPLSVTNVVYSVHMYLPHAFSHQGVSGTWAKSYSYPGEIGGQHWDKAQLEAALKPVTDFQEKYGVHFYIGEFSAIRWAPDNSAYRYLKDVIDIFEAHGWDWSYHAFREWSGWSVEHGTDRDNDARAVEPTDRQKLLLDWFAKDAKPSAATTERKAVP